MARNGYPDDPNNYSESDPTQYANVGSGEAYSEYGPPTGAYGAPVGYGQSPAPVPPPPPWHHRPAVLVGLGVLTAAVLTLLVYAVVKFTTAGTSESPAVTSSSVTATTSSAPGESPAQPRPTGEGGTEPSNSSVAPPPPPSTTTVTAEPTTSAAPTTTEAPSPSTTTSVTTSVTTVTETTTKPVWPTLPRPTRPAPTLQEQEPATGG